MTVPPSAVEHERRMTRIPRRPSGLGGGAGESSALAASCPTAGAVLKAALRRATGSRWILWVARAGYPISGTLHLLVAYLIVRIALGSNGDADQSGAMEAIARTRGGTVALWAVAFGLIALALWRVAEAVIGLHPNESGHDRDDMRIVNRLKAFGLALVYTAVAVTALRFAAGSRTSSGQTNAGISARLVQSTGGKLVLIAIGVVMIVIGGYYAYKGASRRFLNDLTVPGGPVLTPLAVCGYVAEGSVLATAGALVIVASVNADPGKARGIDAAVKALGSGRFGSVLLMLAAVGFAAYGLYCFALTRYARM